MNIGNKPYNIQTCIKPSTVDEKLSLIGVKL